MKSTRIECRTKRWVVQLCLGLAVGLVGPGAKLGAAEANVP